MALRISSLLFCVFCSATILCAGEPATFRTDQSNDEELSWYQPAEGEFPPEGSAHYFAGELIELDHLERSFVLRVDRTDQQRRSHFDLPIAATMLPYGSIHYHGAPAAMADIPLGTHLHGQFYVKNPDQPLPDVVKRHNRVSPEADFTRCFRLEDDFSFHSRRDELWRVDAVDLEEMTLTASLVREGEVDGEPQTFDLQPSTRVWQQQGFAALDQIKKGQHVLFNLTWATIYGPGRLVEIWLDKESRRLATEHQMKRHRLHIRERGLPGWVDAVDNEKRIVTITFFGSAEPQLLEALKEGDRVGVAVAEPSLLTYDPVNDRKRGPIIEIDNVPEKPGSSGIQIRVQPDLLLEGHRPSRIVRVYPSSWPVIALPKEEKLFGQ